jgi:sec-independent protein translocase protein TatC
MPLDQLPDPAEQKQMSFLGHLEELRWHIVRVVVVLVLSMIVAFTQMRWLVEWVILGPLQKDFFTTRFFCSLGPALCPTNSLTLTLQSTDPTEQFTKAILIAFVSAVVVTFPYLAWEVWRFVKPGLYTKEIKNTRGVVAIVSSLFLLGVFFGYAIISPFTVNFLAGFQLSPNVQNIWRIGEVIALIVQLSLAGGILFELPVVVWVLSKLGIVTPKILRRYRRHAIVANLILAGILTPSPDVVSQLLLGIPMIVLYEASILISARVERKRLAQLA